MDRPEYPKTVTLKSKRTVVLRQLQSSDEEKLSRFFTGLPPECTEFLKEDVRSREVARRFINQRDPDRVWAILAQRRGSRGG